MTLSLDDVNFLVETLSLDQLPVVLDIAPTFDQDEQQLLAHRASEESLTERGIVHGGRVRDDVQRALATVARPRWELAVRWSIEGTVSRMCVSYDEHMSIAATRTAEALILRDVTVDPIGAVVGALGAPPAMTFNGINTPTAELVAALDESADPAALASRLTASGANSSDATEVGRAMFGCVSFAEIVGITYGDGNYDPVGGPVTVFDTDAGRVVGTSSVSGHGVDWSSLSPGTSSRLRQALVSLTERLG
ncbi:ESX secretion-associated protein EspG [Rhodococcus rhodnii]|uniref:ESX secretion-associated protein EspG n=1 Tax=Rhodococcus rhodnii TaxID=38312 RepID=A0A6P2CKP1_9NOCA|nr:ESX secretion-associated protein EspG [Rhodococcus rhodnii]